MKSGSGTKYFSHTVIVICNTILNDSNRPDNRKLFNYDNVKLNVFALLSSSKFDANDTGTFSFILFTSFH